MGHVKKELPWCAIDINTTTGHVTLVERWLYTWHIASGQPAWTEIEKTSFHDRADVAIRAAWSNRVKLSVSGASEFAKRMGESKLPLTIDVRRVAAGNHWSVKVTKIGPSDFARSVVYWQSRRVVLDTNDVAKKIVSTTRPNNYQIPVAHEFGHTLGNTSNLGRGDEYTAASSHKSDVESIMNEGNNIRKRHFRTIIEELNKMIPDTEFSVGSLS